uniref:Uncharacterized protein n=1 Tax=Vannella robusta TaxID=1487602 RepID=A0A7S4IIR7_9EUKA|mmetsp:Transcript_3139/g.3858  ORF Transcript_3139/g.3858 Transcript_3139/m.3858 type:complete len:118 (+) Transcript_3139:1211-1564(+)
MAEALEAFDFLFAEPFVYVLWFVAVVIGLIVAWLSTETRPFQGPWSSYLWDQITLALALLSTVGIIQILFMIFVDFTHSRFAFTLSLSDDVVHDDGGFDDDILSEMDAIGSTVSPFG